MHIYPSQYLDGQLQVDNMGQDPREAWRRFQQFAVDRSGRPNVPGGPRGFFGGAAGLILLGATGVFINNALFNGTQNS